MEDSKNVPGGLGQTKPQESKSGSLSDSLREGRPNEQSRTAGQSRPAAPSGIGNAAAGSSSPYTTDQRQGAAQADTLPGPETTMERARRAAGQTTRAAADEVKRKGHELKDSSGRLADSGRQRLSERVRSLQTLCQQAEASLKDSDEEALARAGTYLGEQAGRVADYIDGHDMRQIGSDIARLARQRPSAVIGAALTMGFVVGRLALSAGQRDERPSNFSTEGMRA